MRLFVALNLPETVRASLWATAAPLRDRGFPVKWVRPEGIHLTLKFLGEVAADRQGDVQAGIGRACAGARALPLTLDGFGAFPDTRRPRVVWTGITPEPALELLQHGLERELGPLGFPPEGRPFRPHVTLGRADRDAKTREFAGFADALAGLTFNDTVVVETVDLMRSTLQPGGAVYQAIHRERLD